MITLNPNIFKDKYFISIHDTGVGMEEEKLKNLFKLNRNISNVGTQGEKGTGFGLILCKEFIEMHRGTIKVESILGQGSTFTVEIPINIK